MKSAYHFSSYIYVYPVVYAGTFDPVCTEAMGDWYSSTVAGASVLKAKPITLLLTLGFLEEIHEPTQLTELKHIGS